MQHKESFSYSSYHQHYNCNSHGTKIMSNIILRKQQDRNICTRFSSSTVDLGDPKEDDKAPTSIDPVVVEREDPEEIAVACEFATIATEVVPEVLEGSPVVAEHATPPAEVAPEVCCQTLK